MNTLRTLLLTLVLVSASVHAGERDTLKTYVSPAPSLIALAIGHTKDIGLTDAQKTKLEDWVKASDCDRREHELVDDRQAINKAILDGQTNAEVQKLMQDLQVKELKVVSSKLACRDYIRKVLSEEQYKRLLDLYRAKN